MTISHVVIVSYDDKFQPEFINKNPELGVVQLIMDPPMTLIEALQEVRNFNQTEIDETKGYWAIAMPAATLPRIGETILLVNQN